MKLQRLCISGWTLPFYEKVVFRKKKYSEGAIFSALNPDPEHEDFLKKIGSIGSAITTY